MNMLNELIMKVVDQYNMKNGGCRAFSEGDTIKSWRREIESLRVLDVNV